MTKRMSLWGRHISTPKRRTDSSPGTEEEDPKTAPAATSEYPEAGEWEKPPPATKRRRGARAVAPEKKRNRALSTAVSLEEERMLRTYAASLNQSFSEWSRRVLFRAMGRKVPTREKTPPPKRGRPTLTHT